MLLSVSPPNSRRDQRPNAVRTLVEDAALKLVRRQGWNATSVDQICRTAGVTKGTFFHYFGTKEDLGVAAARRWQEVTSALFAGAEFNRFPDPLQRIHHYLDFRSQLAQGPLEDITCFAGTTLQETFATSEPLRAAVGATIDAHVATLTPHFEAALSQYPPREPVDAALALYTQTVLQGAFVISKARDNTGPVHAAVLHLKRYLAQLFGQPVSNKE